MIECKICKQQKVHVFSHVAESSGNYIYKDDVGRLWKSKVCPSCQAAIRRTRPKKPRTV